MPRNADVKFRDQIVDQILYYIIHVDYRKFSFADAAHADSAILTCLRAQSVINYRSLIRTTVTLKNSIKLPDELIKNDTYLVRRRHPTILYSVNSRALLTDEIRNSLDEDQRFSKKREVDISDRVSFNVE